jgi:hypothetical protein
MQACGAARLDFQQHVKPALKGADRFDLLFKHGGLVSQGAI